MQRGRVPRKAVTHNDLIGFFEEHKSSPKNHALRTKWQCKFEVAMNEARAKGDEAPSALTALLELVHPETGESVCPPPLKRKLERTITQLTANIANKERRKHPQQVLQAQA